MREEQIARNRYESFFRAQASDAVQVALHAGGADRSDEDKPVAGSEGNVSFTVAVQFNIDPAYLSDAGFYVVDARVDVPYPGHIRGLRVEVEDGSVVVELHSHGDDPTEGEGAS